MTGVRHLRKICEGNGSGEARNTVVPLGLWVPILDSPTADGKYSKTSDLAVDVHFVLGPLMVASVLSMCRFFFCHYSLNDIV